MCEYNLELYNDLDRPIVSDLSWGKTTVSYHGTKIEYKDAIIWPTGHCEWDWNVSGTQHSPGIQLLEVKELVEKYNCDYLILTKGMKGFLRTDPKTRSWMKKNGVDYVILNTMDAVELYNEDNDKSTGLLLHSTC